jgi:tetratricopeptide (TPR) repeat protein
MEDQTLNPFHAPTTGGQTPGRRPAWEAVIRSPARWWARELPICLLLIAIILVAYWGVWNFEFVIFDDPGYVTENLNVLRGLPLFKDFKVFRDSVCWAFTAFEQSNWHPLTWLSHMLDVQLYGLKAGGHHVTNIIFHAANTLLLFGLLRRLTGRSWCSAAVAALFAVHPMHVESVAWVAERKDVLSTFLGLLTLLAYVRYAKAPGVFRYIPVFVLLALGLLAKPMLVTLPFVCLLLDYWPLERLNLSSEADSPSRRAAAERPAALRRKAKRNQRLPAAARAPQIRAAAQRPWGEQIVRLVVEKIPLLALSAVSAATTYYAQNHGASMASTAELPLGFRIQNALQSYAGYVGRMFWPGKMMSLHLLIYDEMNQPYVDPRMIALSVAVILLLTVAAVVAFIHGRRYLPFGWLWYVGTLVPVVGFVQVGEQAMADRYTYIPYIGLFVAIVWAVAELLEKFAFQRRALAPAATLAMVVILGSWTSWTNYQVQTWRDVPAHLRHSLDVEPDNWNMLNNYGVRLWTQAQDEEFEAVKAEAAGDLQAAKAHHQKALALKDDAKAQWNHGIAKRPLATDIHSNLAYAYTEANDLDKAEWHLTEAVKLKPTSARPRNNLGRVLLSRSQQREAEAGQADAKAKTDPAEAARAKQLRAEAKAMRDAAIEQFEKAVELDPALLEARLNLGQVYLSLNDLDKAEFHYLEILKLRSESVKVRTTINNFSQACLGLARVALARKKPDEAIQFLRQSLELDPHNENSLQLLAIQQFQRGAYREGEKGLWPLLAMLPKAQRRSVTDQLGRQFEAAGRHREAAQIWNFTAWALATSPDPHILDPEAALAFAKHVVAMTQARDPVALDTLAAAEAANGQFLQAVEVAQAAINLATSQGNKPLAEAISRRLQSYQQQKPYRCDPSGSDRPF